MPPWSTIVLVVGMWLLIPINLWHGYFPRFKGSWYSLPQRQVFLQGIERGRSAEADEYAVKIPFEMLRYAIEVPANTTPPPVPPALGYVQVMIATDHYFQTARSAAFPTLLVTGSTLALWLFLALAEDRRRRRATSP